MVDPMADWWIHQVTIRRLDGNGPYGEVWSDPQEVSGFVNDTRQLVRDNTGSEVVSSTQVFLPAGTAWIPPGSKITLPSVFGDREAIVITTAVRDAGHRPVPAHVEVSLQ